MVGTASQNSRSAGRAAAGHRPRLCRLGDVRKADLEQEGVVFALPQRLDDHAGAVRHADYSLGPRQAIGVADGDMRFRDCGFCCPCCATARVAAGRACVMGRAWRSGTSVVLMVSSCHAARRCSSWSGLQTSVEGLAYPGSCPLFGAPMVCSRTASGQGSPSHSRPGWAPAAS